MSEETRLGHNGGPSLRRGRKLTDAQDRALRCIRDYANSAHGLVGRSMMGGYNNTDFWLRTQELRTWDKATRIEALTERGRRVLEAGRLVD